MNIDCLTALLRCHSTPGDETAVREFLGSFWEDRGLSVTHHGHFAISARAEKVTPEKPTLLVCAHMDSPGFIVEQIHDDRLTLVRLGGATMPEPTATGVLRTASGLHVVTITATETDNGSIYNCDRVDDVVHGDRVCFRADPTVVDEKIASPFLDNRLGCFVLTELASDLEAINNAGAYNVVLGATVCEEIGGFGAPVLAKEVDPDLVICLDATYEAEEQNVHLGSGPVLTISDASVIISCEQRDHIKSIFSEHDIPLQTEVYNYSGTDARAFPHMGLGCPVYALLLATRGNHTPEEIGALCDIESLIKGIKAISSDYGDGK